LPSLFNWGRRKVAAPAPAVERDAGGLLTTSKVLPKFLAALSTRPAPVLIDLGPVIGPNISFFGDQLSCKIHVEDFFAEVEAHARDGTRANLARALAARLGQDEGSVDGVLCWGIFDFLDKDASRAVAAAIVKLLRSGGAVHAFFGTGQAELTQYTRFVVESPTTLRLRTAPATPAKRNVLVTRDINRMFEGLVVSESVLLKNSTREAMFRKP
jgi:hypothetical protein